MRTVGRKRKIDTHLPKRVYLLHGAYFFYPKIQDRARIGGKSCKRLGSNLADAMKAYADIIEPDSGTLGEIWEAYRIWLSATNKRTGRPNNSGRSVDDKAIYWERMKPVFAHAGPNTVTPKFINQYLRKRERQGAGTQGNKEIALLSHMYTMAIYWEMDVAGNPCQGVKRNPTGARDLSVTPEMISSWVEFAPPRVALATELMYMTGIRSPDAIRIELADLSPAGISVRAGKTGKRAVYPWDDGLKAVVKELRALPKRKDGTPVFSKYLICSSRGKPYTKSGFDSLWQKAAVKYAAAGHVRFAPNDCRSAYADELENQGGDATKNLQHSSRQVTTRHYLRRPAKLATLGRIK